MRTFKDTAGREWQVALSIGTAKRIKDAIDLDILDNGQAVQRIATDPYLMGNVLFLVCEPQCKALGVTDEQFGESLAGDVIDDALTAFIEELVDFFPKRQRPALTAMLAKLTDVQDQAATLATAKVASPEMTARIQREMEKAASEIDHLLTADLLVGGSGSGNAPGSSAGAGLT